MKTEHIEPFFAALKAANPQPETELEYTNVFELLAAVLLSAQATDVGVNKATRRLFAVANSPERVLALGLPALTEHLRTIGLFRTKAKNLHATCRILVEQHGGQVPRTREALEALPGVGRKTANVVLNVAFGEPSVCRGHAHLPGRQPHRAGERQDAAGGGVETARARTRRIPRRRAPLADPAWPLCVPGPPSAVRPMRRRALVRRLPCNRAATCRRHAGRADMTAVILHLLARLS